MISSYDVIVVGGGHGGTEAANAAAKMGAKTLLITMSKDTIAKMSCNPAIGGIAKGQIVREIDALGGVMGIAIDATGIQFRILNSSKGPAVQSPRAQADKYKYKDFVRQYLEQLENLDIVEGMVCDVIVEGGSVTGVKCADGSQYAAKAVIITAGTFLRGLMHIGEEQFPGGRLDEPASNELSVSLEKLGLTLGRLKTGTPARLDAKTIDYDKCETQYGDNPAVPFSFLTKEINQPQLPCWITYTNPEIHQLLKQCIDEGRSPLYSGQILSIGARYCPSIETKIMRFADKSRHMVFLEPEDSQNSTIYCNGVSTSVPRDVQEKMFKLMPGTENARIVHYAYAIEYDFCPPQQLKINLETKIVKGLFLAGQVNGTSGYEEAAGQGLMAGINAVRMLQNKEPFVLRRDQAYIGVMIDDLLTRGVDEPYRMFTSRAEYRLLLRSDNADRRLTAEGRKIGFVDDNRWAKFCDKMQAIEKIKAYIKGTRTGGQSLWEHLKKPQNTLADLIKDCAEPGDWNLSGDIIEAVSIDAKYEGYLARQEKVVENFRKLENQKLPENIDYYGVPHLRAEAKEKLTTLKPYTLAQAGRISGITPADITVLQVYLKHTKA